MDHAINASVCLSPHTHTHPLPLRVVSQVSPGGLRGFSWGLRCACTPLSHQAPSPFTVALPPIPVSLFPLFLPQETLLTLSLLLQDLLPAPCSTNLVTSPLALSSFSSFRVRPPRLTRILEMPLTGMSTFLLGRFRHIDSLGSVGEDQPLGSRSSCPPACWSGLFHRRAALAISPSCSAHSPDRFLSHRGCTSPVPPLCSTGHYDSPCHTVAAALTASLSLSPSLLSLLA